MELSASSERGMQKSRLFTSTFFFARARAFANMDTVDKYLKNHNHKIFILKVAFWVYIFRLYFLSRPQDMQHKPLIGPRMTQDARTKTISPSHFRLIMHQSIPSVPIPPRATPRALAFFFKWQIPGGGDK